MRKDNLDFVKYINDQSDLLFRNSNSVYKLHTKERWKHILNNRPSLDKYKFYLIVTIEINSAIKRNAKYLLFHIYYNKDKQFPVCFTNKYNHINNDYIEVYTLEDFIFEFEKALEGQHIKNIVNLYSI